MAKTINFKTDDGKAYTLEFTRKTIIATENLGFSLNAITDKPMGMLDILFKGAFLAHHDTLTVGEVEAIFDKIDKAGLLDALIQLYNAPLESLVDEEHSKNSVKWTIT